MNSETHRFFSINDRSVYDTLRQFVNSTRDYTNGKNAGCELPHWDKLFTESESPTGKLYCLERCCFDESDEVQLQSAIDTGAIFELDHSTFMQKLYWEPPFVDEFNDEVIDPGWSE